MASRLNSFKQDPCADSTTARLWNENGCIGTPSFDALLIWGAPLIAFTIVLIAAVFAKALPEAASSAFVKMTVGLVAILTYAHLFAVIPRAYLNTDVFASNKIRLTVVPIIVVVGLLASPIILAFGIVAAFFWDVHHSAMQTFGLARIYDMKAGNGGTVLRATDLRLNWAIYVGPLAAGASLVTHLMGLSTLKDTGIRELAMLPGVLVGDSWFIRDLAIGAWLITIGWAAWDYRKAIRQGYRIPAHKMALMVVTTFVTTAAWGFAPPVVALATVNVFHAVQYFALVWNKEGGRMAGLTSWSPKRTMGWFIGGCGAAGIAYATATTGNLNYLVAPFIAVSLLHFWFDSFVWSVRKKQV